MEQFPRLWLFFFKVYGVKPFNQSRLNYTKRSSILENEKSLPSRYEVVFDAQCLQTLTRQRGIGKYSLSLIQAICKEEPEKKFAAYLTNIASRSELEIAKELLKSLKCNNLTVLVFDLFEDSNKITFQQSQEFLGTSLKSYMPKVVISLSNFEKPETCIPAPRNSAFRTIAILYDLIPLQFAKQLLVSRRQESTYRWLLSNLQKFDYLLSISNTTQEVWRALVSNSTQIRVIGGAGYSLTLRKSHAFEVRNGVLCIGSEQGHKNLERLILAYSMLPLSIRLAQKLTIVGIRSSGSRKYLLRTAKKLNCDLVLPEYLAEDELKYLYGSNKILVMPSLSEGLSLPILEAWANGLPAIGSSGTVAEELIQDRSFLFDPMDPNSITRMIEVLLLDQTEWERALLHSEKLARNYSWELTAQLSIKAISEMGIRE